MHLHYTLKPLAAVKSLETINKESLQVHSYLMEKTGMFYSEEGKVCGRYS